MARRSLLLSALLLAAIVVASAAGSFQLNSPEYAPFPDKDTVFSLTPFFLASELPNIVANGLSVSVQCDVGRTSAEAGQELRWTTAVPLTKSFVFRAPASPLRGSATCTFTSSNPTAAASFTAEVVWGAQLALTPVLINADLELGDTAYYTAVEENANYVELAWEPEAAIGGSGVTIGVTCARGHFQDGTGQTTGSLFLEAGTVGLSTQRLVYVAPAGAGMDECKFALTGSQRLRFRKPKKLVIYVQSSTGQLPGTFSKARFPQSIPLGAISEPIAVQPIDATIPAFDSSAAVGLVVYCRYGRTSSVDQTQNYLAPARLEWAAGAHMKQFFRYEAPRVTPPGAQDKCWFELTGDGTSKRFLPVHEGPNDSTPGVIQLLPVGAGLGGEAQATFDNEVKKRVQA